MCDTAAIGKCKIARPTRLQSWYLGYARILTRGVCVPAVTYHQVHLEAVVEPQSRYIVGLLQVVNHQQLPVLQTAGALQEPL